MNTKELLTIGIAIFLVHCEEFRPRPIDASRPQDANGDDVQDVSPSTEDSSVSDSGTCQTCNGDGVCRDFHTDRENCGACGMSCGGRFPNATPTCTGGACALASCNAGFANCDNNSANGCESNTSTSTTHCGACGNTCSFANASATCASGRCAFGTCNTGFGNCDGIAENGCETNLNTAVNNCRACGTICSTTTPGLVPVCTSGTCGTALGTCPSGRADCNGMAGDGCEVDTSTSLANCGACGQSCARSNGSVSCIGGVCLLGTCNSGFGNCDGDAVNGCETNTRTSITHCGGCGRPCFFFHAAATCASGTCALGACSTAFANCDSNASNGCETSLASDRNNCGACDRRCASGEDCYNGLCIVQCQPGQSNCSGSCVNTQTDRANCGACGRACTGGQVCSNRVCTTSCGAGQTNCSGTCRDLTNDASNCGSCGTTCTGLFANSAPSCVASTCALGTCNAGFANCDNNATNGCETNTISSTTHCGACRTNCPSGGMNNTLTSECLFGRCNCAAGFRDCDTSRANGCESNRLTDPNNCGECGVVCSGGTPACILGTCQPTGCGANGQACCSGTICGSGLACVSGNCTSACGSSAQPCCAGNVCSGGRSCSGGLCVP